MKSLFLIGIPLGIIYLASRADKTWPSGAQGTGPGQPLMVAIGSNQYRVESIPQGKRVVAYDVQGRAITSITYAPNRSVIDVNVLGDYPDNLVQQYHNQTVVDVTQHPEKFGL